MKTLYYGEPKRAVRWEFVLVDAQGVAVCAHLLLMHMKRPTVRRLDSNDMCYGTLAVMYRDDEAGLIQAAVDRLLDRCNDPYYGSLTMYTDNGDPLELTSYKLMLYAVHQGKLNYARPDPCAVTVEFGVESLVRRSLVTGIQIHGIEGSDYPVGLTAP